jgi:hypothetical protein
MSSITLYDRIHDSNIEDIGEGRVEIDRYLATAENDPRMGISLIIPIVGNSENYRELVNRFERVEPDQYYYPFGNLHITVFDFIQGSADYRRDEFLEKTFLEISREAVEAVGPFAIHFRGVAFSRGAGILRGYDGDALISIRRNIRSLLKERGIRNDERYESESAHVTFTRFRAALRNPPLFRETIEASRSFDLGDEEVSSLELVEHDWYNLLQRKRVIARPVTSWGSGASRFSAR